MLQEVISLSANVYIFMNAVDECPKLEGERGRLLETLHEMHAWNFDSLHILSTSRKDGDIVDSLRYYFNSSIAFQTVAVEGSRLTDDIENFLTHPLQRPQFRRWNSKLKKDIGDSLALRSDGM